MVATLVGCAWLSLGACEGGDGDQGNGGGGGTSSSSTAGGIPAVSVSAPSTSTGGGGTGGQGSGGGGISSVPPEGWVKWTEYSESCPLYHAPSAELMPEPIEWEPCPDAPAGLDCEVMHGDGSVAGTSDLDVHEGTTYLLTRRVTSEYWLDFVADVDGPVVNAVMRVVSSTDTPTKVGCAAGPDDLNQGHYVLGIRGHDAFGDSNDSPHRGAMGGVIGDPVPRLLAHYDHDIVYSFWVDASWLMRIGAYESILTVAPWESLSPDTVITSPPLDPESLKASQPLITHGVVFWATATLYQHGINVWDPVNGARPLVRYEGDFTRGAGDLGTDGVDLVWAQGEGKEPQEYKYPIRHMMTAPFTSDPAALAPRRLRSTPYSNIGSQQWEVGCGYASHTAGSYRVAIVRLSDGVSWLVSQQAPDFLPSTPLGIDCTHAYMFGLFDGRYTIARVALASLGAGTPPD